MAEEFTIGQRVRFAGGNRGEITFDKIGYIEAIGPRKLLIRAGDMDSTFIRAVDHVTSELPEGARDIDQWEPSLWPEALKFRSVAH